MTAPNALNDSASGAYKVNSLVIHADANPNVGDVGWDAARSLWNGGMLITAVVFCPVYFTWDAFAVFIVLLELTMCTGTRGVHRRLIHRTSSVEMGRA